MELDQDDIIKIMKLIDESTFVEFKLQIGDLRLTVSKSERNPGKFQPDISRHKKIAEQNLNIMTENIRKEEVPRLIPSIAEDKMQEKTNRPATIISEEGLIPIKSPVLGTFYTSPKPGDPPFVEIGTLVHENDTICIIEIMKLFNSIKAGIRGRIKKILAKNGDIVECQQVLFLVQSE